MLDLELDYKIKIRQRRCAGARQMAEKVKYYNILYK